MSQRLRTLRRIDSWKDHIDMAIEQDGLPERFNVRLRDIKAQLEVLHKDLSNLGSAPKTIRDRVYKIVENEFSPRSPLEDSTLWVEDLGLDSLDLIELVMEIEKEFNIDIDDQEALGLKTFGALVKYLEDHEGQPYFSP